MSSRFWSVLVICLVFGVIIGCSHGDPVNMEASDGQSAEQGTNQDIAYNTGHFNWGIWDVTCDPETGNIEPVPLRSASLNGNILRFLQPPASPVLLLTISLATGSDIPNGLICVNMAIRHPFIGHNRFRGFDMRGIILAEGGMTGLHDPTVNYHMPDGTRMLNPDGYTRWWNQVEFTTYDTIFGYTEGWIKVPGFVADATINPYKLFADDLDELESLGELDPDTRATFGLVPGINIRRYEMQFNLEGDPPVRFRYSVDVSWSLPDPAYEPEFPIEAFDLSANCQEPYMLNITQFEEIPYYVDDTNRGGKAVFQMVIGDWQAESGESVLDQLSHIWVESPTMLENPIDVLPTAEFVSSNHHTQGIFRITVPNCVPSGLDGQRILVTAESAWPDTYAPNIGGDTSMFDYPDSPLAAFNLFDVPINPEAPQQEDFYVYGLPDWCSLTEFCTDGADNLQFVTNLVSMDLVGSFNDNNIVKWWGGKVNPHAPYSTSIIQNHVNSLGYTFSRTYETEFDPTDCRVVIVNFVRSGSASYLPFSSEEVAEMKDFVANGGILAFLIENPSYFDPVTFDPLMDSLGVPFAYGGAAEPPSTTTPTTDITDHPLTAGVETWQYWTCGEFLLESEDCISLVRSPTGEHIVVVAPIDVE